MSFSIKLGNFLYKHAFVLYKPLYKVFKNKQDYFEIALLKKHIHKKDVVLDIGANIGFYAVILSDIVGPQGMVHCFEPDIQNYKHLKKNTGKHSNIIINNKAVGSKTEKIKIYTSKNLNVDHRTYKPEVYDKEIEIDAININDYLNQNPKVDFIKMDIQGFEMQAIKGMQTILEKNENIKLISEFWPYGLKKAGSSVTEYFNFLINNGFNCYLIEKKSLLKLNSEKVKALEVLGEEHYFNIFASRTHV
jgi:FkbM family methyltransferase